MSSRQSTEHPLREARSLARDLRALGEVSVPPSLLPAVLERSGHGDYCFTVDSPVGPVYVAYSARGVSMVDAVGSAEEFAERYKARLGRTVRPATHPPTDLREAVLRRLRGEEHTDVRFDLSELTEFERAVLLQALRIPRGQVRPYEWIAREIGHPKAQRAVGSALAHNPIPLLIPCHRVVRKDGTLGRYSLIDDGTKRAVLRAEGLDVEELEALARAGFRYTGSDTTGIYCFPTCSHARRVTDAHRMRFHSEAEATAAGYRPCKICRPMAHSA